MFRLVPSSAIAPDSSALRPARRTSGYPGADGQTRFRDLKVAIVHYWLVRMRGGEKVVEALCELFPNADIYTHVYDPAAVSPVIRRHFVRETFIARLPRARRWYQYYLPLMPLALEQIDLRGYDLVITSESGPAKGILPQVSAKHVCYCHTPMRYIWNMYRDYLEGAGFLRRLVVPWVAHRLRQWDVTTAARVDRFVANSHATAARIRRYYGRDSIVVHPPVDTESFQPIDECSGHLLYVGELVPYKRPEQAVEACNRLGLPLVVIGGGEMLEELRRLAGPTVKILGWQPFEVLRDNLRRCRALIFPGEEDFGIVPVEALACGRPVVALGRGGALETAGLAPGCVLYDEPSVEALIEAIRRLLAMPPAPQRELVEVARLFSRARFFTEIEQVIGETLREPVGARSRMVPGSFAGVVAESP